MKSELLEMQAKYSGFSYYMQRNIAVTSLKNFTHATTFYFAVFGQIFGKCEMQMRMYFDK